MQTYESPKITFQHLTLFEKIATTCWSASSAFFDGNLNGRQDGGEGLTLKNGSCRSNNDSILSQMRQKLGWFYPAWYYGSGAWESGILANTRALGIHVDFTSGCSPTPTPTPKPTPTQCPPPQWPGHHWWH